MTKSEKQLTEYLGECLRTSSIGEFDTHPFHVYVLLHLYHKYGQEFLDEINDIQRVNT